MRDTFCATRELSRLTTVSQEQRFDQDGVTIHVLPAWRWLLQEDAFADGK